MRCSPTIKVTPNEAAHGEVDDLLDTEVLVESIARGEARGGNTSSVPVEGDFLRTDATCSK